MGPNFRSHEIVFTDPESPKEIKLRVKTSGPGMDKRMRAEKPDSSIFLAVHSNDIGVFATWVPKEIAEEFALAILTELKNQDLEDQERGK